jgi:hypothetical protein
MMTILFNRISYSKFVIKRFVQPNVSTEVTASTVVSTHLNCVLEKKAGVTRGYSCKLL